MMTGGAKVGQIIGLLGQTALLLVASAGLLFLAAGTARWPQAWLYLGELAGSNVAVGSWLLRHDPALLTARLSGLWQRDQVAWDRIFMLMLVIVFVLWTVLIGLDARRFAWSHVPVWVETLGAALIALGMLVVWQTFRVNTFAAPQVRMQQAREHRVVTGGPYRVVRHPMYAGGILYLLGTPLLLGSWYGVAAVPLLIAGIAVRAVGEERLLRRELTGYDEYASRVRFRLVPGIW